MHVYFYFKFPGKFLCEVEKKYALSNTNSQWKGKLQFWASESMYCNKRHDGHQQTHIIILILKVCCNV